MAGPAVARHRYGGALSRERTRPLFRLSLEIVDEVLFLGAFSSALRLLLGSQSGIRMYR